MSLPTPSYRQHRYPAEIIVHCVRLYDPFPLSHRGVADMMFERGVVVSDEAIRKGCHKAGARYCHGLAPTTAAAAGQMAPRRDAHRHIKMNGTAYYLWRAGDAEGLVLDILVQERHDQEAATAFLQRVVEGPPDEPRVAVTDKLASYGPTLKRVLPRTDHRKHKG